MANQREVQVFLVLGFLDSGKTTFLQETLEDARSDDGGRTLLLVCEEGDTEYVPEKFGIKHVDMVTIEDEGEFTQSTIEKIDKEKKPTQVFVEFNGMWLLSQFFDAMPEDWVIVNLLTLFDATTFINYNANMRQLVYDKISMAQLVVLNRFKSEYNKEEYHKILRAASRRMDIVYEDPQGKTEVDDIEDPLPYDITAPVIRIEDRDFAYFYRDIVENPGNYKGKTVKFLAMVEYRRNFPTGMILVGRHIMTCCQADIAYNAFALMDKKLPGAIKARDWIVVTAKVSYGTCKLYEGEGPILSSIAVEAASSPAEVVATYY